MKMKTFVAGCVFVAAMLMSQVAKAGWEDFYLYKYLNAGTEVLVEVDPDSLLPTENTTFQTGASVTSAGNIRASIGANPVTGQEYSVTVTLTVYKDGQSIGSDSNTFSITEGEYPETNFYYAVEITDDCANGDYKTRIRVDVETVGVSGSAGHYWEEWNWYVRTP